MKVLTLLLTLALLLPVPVQAAELTAPEVPSSGAELMPENTDSFGDALWELLGNALTQLRPDLKEATRVSLSVAVAVMLVSLLQALSESGKAVGELAGSVAIGTVLLMGTNSLIRLGVDTVAQLSQYGKLLLPVMTTALAAQGGVSASAALYAGTAVFDSVLNRLIASVLAPMVYLFLALAVGSSAVGTDVLKKMRDTVRSFISWSLKILLTVFTTYMSITGVVSGTTDAAALKATKVTISSVVPVVGSVLSDASEAVLVSAGVMKNTAGIYGILAVLAVFLAPFLRIGVHYLVLKLTAALCAVFGTKAMTELIGDFASAMGLLLAMTGSGCLLVLISTVCFLKGVG